MLIQRFALGKHRQPAALEILRRGAFSSVQPGDGNPDGPFVVIGTNRDQ